MNKSGLFSVAFIFLSIHLLVINTYSQGCCGIGGSLVSGGHPVLNKHTFLVNTSGNYAVADNPSRRRRGSTGILLAYGLIDRLSLSIKTSYIWASYTENMPPWISADGNDTLYLKDQEENSGFGDGYAALQFVIIRLTPINKQELIAGLDLGIPWGPDSKMINGVTLQDNVQTGTGGFSLNGYVTYLKAFPRIYYSITTTIAGRLNFKTRRGKDPGDEFSVLLTSLLGPLFNTRGSVTFNYSRNGKDYSDEFTNVMTISPKTSGQRLSFIPALEYSFTSNFKFLINADLPLWRDKYATLNDNDKAFSAQIYWFIPITKDNPEPIKSISF
ncbi:MAG: hypothetical protein JW915_14295 [Chitinispirillaceae bacterium]|nr:hypothetical protein [Chitinispirillaceae bacterium]